MLRPLLVCVCLSVAASASAGVLVVANRTGGDVAFDVASLGSDVPAVPFKVSAGQSIPILLDRPAQLTFTSGGKPKGLRVGPGGLYYFGEKEKDALDLAEIGLSAADPRLEKVDADTTPEVTQPIRAAQPCVVIPVKILYDDVEPMRPDVWERKIRARFENASRIFKQYCFVEFKVVAVDHWKSDKELTTLEQALTQFEREVKPGPARLAVGFTAQHRGTAYPADGHMAGTRGALHTHLLVREWVAKNNEPEKLELLMHELGHFLGASHSPEPNSAMRPYLADRKARFVKFKIGFDPLNTLAMCLVSQELRANFETRPRQMTTATRIQLARIYAELARAMPKDKSSVGYLSRVIDRFEPAN